MGVVGIGFLILLLLARPGNPDGDPELVRAQALADAQAVLVPLSEVEVWASALADDHAAWEDGSGGATEAAAARDELAERISLVQRIESELNDPTERLRPALRGLVALWEDVRPLVDAHANCRVRDDDCSTDLVELRRGLEEVRAAAGRAIDTVREAVA